jgi:uncharacterized protein
MGTKMTVAADASPLILLSRAGRLDLLQQLFEEVQVPPAVADETFRSDPARPGAPLLRAAFVVWLREVEPVNVTTVRSLRPGLGQGEAEAIALALERRLPLLIDEVAGRDVAQRLDIRVTDSAGVLILAKQAGLLPAVRPLLDRLIDEGLWLSTTLYSQILRRVGELKLTEGNTFQKRQA